MEKNYNKLINPTCTVQQFLTQTLYGIEFNFIHIRG